MLVGPYFPVLELQARWLALVWSGTVALPSAEEMRAGVAEFSALKSLVPTDIHHALAGSLAAEIGVAPDLLARPELTRSLIFGPPVPARYLLDGPGAVPAGEELYREALAAFGTDPSDQLSEQQLAGLELVAKLLGDEQLRSRQFRAGRPRGDRRHRDDDLQPAVTRGWGAAANTDGSVIELCVGG